MYSIVLNFSRPVSIGLKLTGCYSTVVRTIFNSLNLFSTFTRPALTVLKLLSALLKNQSSKTLFKSGALSLAIEKGRYSRL